MKELEKIIAFAEKQLTTDVHAHRGAYSTIIDFVKTLQSEVKNLTEPVVMRSTIMISPYPQVQIIQKEKEIEFRTKLIKEANGKYYYWNFMQKWKVKSEEDKLKYLNEFHSNIYHTIILGKVDTNLKMADGTPLFELAIEQITEEQRIRNYLSYF